MKTLILQLTNFTYRAIAAVGGSHIKTTNATYQVNNLNNLLIKAGVAVGVVLLVIGIMKLLMSLADENPKGKMDASIFLGVGAFFLGMSTVVNTLRVTNGTTVQSVTEKILTIIGSLCGYAGVTLLIVTILLIIFAFAQEQPEAMSKASTSAGVSIGLMSARILINVIKATGILGGVASGQDMSGSLIGIVVSFLSGVIGYVGITLIPLGVFKLVYGIRTEDTEGRNGAIKIICVGVACTAFRTILYAFGI